MFDIGNHRLRSRPGFYFTVKWFFTWIQVGYFLVLLLPLLYLGWKGLGNPCDHPKSVYLLVVSGFVCMEIILLLYKVAYEYPAVWCKSEKWSAIYLQSCFFCVVMFNQLLYIAMFCIDIYGLIVAIAGASDGDRTCSSLLIGVTYIVSIVGVLSGTMRVCCAAIVVVHACTSTLSLFLSLNGVNWLALLEDAEDSIDVEEDWSGTSASDSSHDSSVSSEAEEVDYL